jgi:hypothetical protein
MAKINTALALSLTLIIAMSCLTLLILNSANAQTTPKPSVPLFTLDFVDRSFTTNDGVYYDSKTIQVTVANQPSLNHSLFYNVRYRVDSGNWMDLYTMDDAYPPQSDSEYTIISVYLHPQGNATLVPTNSIVDVQVEAMIGYIHRGYNPNHTSQLDMYPYVFTGETSGWSNTQTIILATAQPSSTVSEFTPLPPTDGNAPHLELIDYLLLISIIIVVIVVLSLLIFSMHRKTAKPTQ